VKLDVRSPCVAVVTSLSVALTCRFTPESGHVQCSSPCLLWANSGLMQCKKRGHSITSSVRNKSDVGMDIPRA